MYQAIVIRVDKSKFIKVLMLIFSTRCSS